MCDHLPDEHEWQFACYEELDANGNVAMSSKECVKVAMRFVCICGEEKLVERKD